MVSEELLEETIQYFFHLGRIVAIYEPADPLLNMYNMNLLFESTRRVTIEVVGPGFDASDLQRGDLSPHETFSVDLSSEGLISDLRLVQRVDRMAYAASVILRKDKIRKKLASAPSTDLARRIRVSLAIPEDLNDLLMKIGSPLREAQAYQPVPENLLRDTLSEIAESRVVERYTAMTGVGFPLVVSTSLVNRGSRQVYWDIVSPTLKFEGLTSSRT